MPAPGSAAPADPRDGVGAEARGEGLVLHGDNLAVLPAFADASFTVIYLDPPFNTGRAQARRSSTATRVVPDARGETVDAGEAGAARAAGGADSPAPVPGRVTGFQGRQYDRIKGDLLSYDDRFDDYWGFLEPRIVEAWRLLADDGTLYLHLDYREAHYAKVLLDALFGRESFLNEIIWAYDYGAKSKNRWPTKHDTILVYVKNPAGYYFDSTTVDREPYMAPGLVTPEKAASGKLPTDVWWHTIVSPTGREKTGYPTQKPEGILRRIVQASSREGDWVLDFFAGSGTTGAVAAALGRNFVLVDQSADALAVMRRRLPAATFLP
ncbi:site-specific DNA-methyltransferase [Herbiconiux sp. 11R-BC]|uniref:DNA-methyltransferase n=1 Tax=Herbiconiux sp. 11R-BC TaxID=3111637 RepID=UPI003BFE1881